MPGQTTRLAIRITAEDDKASAKIIKLGDVAERTGRRASTSMDKAGKSLSDFNAKSSASPAKVIKIGDAAESAGRQTQTAFSRSTQSLATFNAAAGRAQSSITRLVATAAAAYSVERMAEAIVSTGTSFEHQMKIVQGVARASGDEIEALEARARSMGETTEWSASQSAEGLQYLAMAGMDAGKQIKALPGMLDLATAANTDLGRAADVATDTLDAMGLSVNELDRVSDNIVGTITRSNTTFDLMSETLKYSAPVAAAYGYEIERLSALIGVLASKGIKGSMAGTQLSAAFGDASKVFEFYDVSATNADGTTKDLVDALELMRDRGMAAADVMSIFGERSGRAMLALQDAPDRIRALEMALRSAQGETSKLAAMMRDDLTGDYKTMMSTLESVALDIYDIYRTDLRQAVQDLTQWIRSNKAEILDMAAGVQELAQHVATLIAVVGNLFKDTLALWTAMPAVIQDLGIVGALIGGAKARAAIVLISTAIGLTKQLIDVAQAGDAPNQSDRIAAEMEMLQAQINRNRQIQEQFSELGATPDTTQFNRYEAKIDTLLEKLDLLKERYRDELLGSKWEPKTTDPLDVTIPTIPDAPSSPLAVVTGGQTSADKALADERVRIEEDLTNRIEELTLDRYTYQRVLLERELADIRSKDGYKTADAATQKAIEDQLAEYKTAKLAEIAAAEDKYLQEQAKKRAEAAEKALRESDDMWAGIASGFEKSLPKMESGFERMERMSKATFSSIGTASTTLMANIFKGNIHSMEDAAVSALNTLIDAVAQAQSQIWGQALAAGISSAGTYFFGSGDSGTTTVPATTSPTIMVAHGGSFASRSLADYESSVVTSPTLFRFASGGVGLMGEESGAPGEAVMPLTRLPGGDLGVRASTPGRASGDTVVNIQVNNNTGNDTQASATASRGRNGEINVVVQLETALAQRINYGQGKLGSVLQSTYGLSRTGRTI